MRKKLIVGNYKMNYTLIQAENFVESIKDRINTNEVDVAICPNFVALDRVQNIIEDTNISLGAQNVYYEEKGAYTGETSVDMLVAAGVKYCIVGHSERREIFSETDEIVNLKIKALLQKDLYPILCVGETLKQREGNVYKEHIKNQIDLALRDIDGTQVARNITIAYEPIWAIGTGKTATSEQAEEICKYIRDIIDEKYGQSVSNTIRILYGGSVKPKNSKEILSMENIDGALVGGASLTEDFVAIVNY